MARFMLCCLVVLCMSSVQLFAQDAPSGEWTFYTIRPEAAPQSSMSRDDNGSILVITGNGDDFTDGRWQKRVPLNGAKHVTLNAKFKAENIEMFRRNVIATVRWFNAEGKESGMPGYAATDGAADAQGWRPVSASFEVPKNAAEGQIELRMRWSPNGKVEWRDAELTSAEAPAARNVKVAVVHHRPQLNKTVQDNLDQFAPHIDAAGKAKADIICLPEAITLIGRGANYLANVEPIPGPSTKFLGEVAKRNNIYIVAGLLEQDGKAAYNTAVLIGRDGSLVGKYRKVCLPRAEIDGGLAPGSEYPVFETDFGKVGIMICWDVSYPEVARELTYRGAELLLMPIWGGYEPLCKARAMENQIPLAMSSYDLVSTIYDARGEPKARVPNTKVSEVIYATLNLAENTKWSGIGNRRAPIWSEGPVRPEVKESTTPESQASR